MQTRRRKPANRTRLPQQEHTALVLGSHEVGSAVALGLHRAGWAVVLIDEVDPPGPWRGMSFVNAWYFGTAELDGVAACFCASVRSIPSIIDRRGLIAATTWSWHGVLGSLGADLLVDARAANGGSCEPLRALAPQGLPVISCGGGYRAPVGADIVVDTSHGPTAGRWTRHGSAPADPGTRARLAGVGEERLLLAPCNGRFRSQMSLADRVEAGEVVGDVNGQPLHARMGGVLRAVSARGARVREGDVVAEVDSRGDPATCYGVDARAHAIARGVLDALARWRDGPREPSLVNERDGLTDPPAQTAPGNDLATLQPADAL